MSTSETTESTLKAELQAQYTDVLTTTEMTALYDVEGFCAPCVVVRRKSDGKRGSLEFTHMPRFYFNFIEA